MKLIVFICLIGLALQGAAQTPSDSTVAMRFRIFYPVGKTELHEDYMDNAQTLQHIQKYLEQSSQIDSITIYSYGSPDGAFSRNQHLATGRGKTLQEYLSKQLPAHPALSASRLVINATAENWSGLRELVVAQYPYANREEVLAVLNRTDISDDRREELLMALDNGKSWRYLLNHLMPQLRYATWVTVWKHVETEPLAEVELVQEVDTITAPQPIVEVQEPAPALVLNEPETQPRWGVKTNLLYAAVLSPSIELEYRVAPRWSVVADFAIAWWSNKPKHQYYQIAQLSPEVRYWFNGDRFWKGHYIGAFLGAGHYDLEDKADGYKGEFTMAGLSYGYMFRIGRYLSLDAGIGVGYMNTEYEEYLPIEGHYVYQQTSRTSYVGPLKAKLSLVWHFGRKLAKGGKR